MDRPAPPPKPPASPGGASAPPSAQNAQEVTEALRVLRERYRASVLNIVAGFRLLAAQLTVAPEKAELLESVRRELHRVHGTAGSFGYPNVSHLAGVLEARATQWAADPAFDRGTRGAIVAHFASALEAHVCGTPAPPVPTRAPAQASPQAPAQAPPQAPAQAPSQTPGMGSGQTAAAAPTPSAAPPPTARDPQPASAPQVVIVEDDPSLTEMLRYALEASGYTFQHYATGPDALDGLVALKTGGRRPLVLLDVDLPGLDGFSIYERVRTARPGAFAVVFFTVHATEAEQLRAYRAGAIDYVTKPVNMRILMAKLPSWIDHATGGGGGAGGPRA